MRKRPADLTARKWLKIDLRRTLIPCLGFLLAAGAVAMLSAQEQEGKRDDQDVHADGRSRGTLLYAPHGRGDLGRSHDKGAAPAPPSGNGINYHGGPVIIGGANIHYIWYGNWSGELSSAQNILDNLAKFLDASSGPSNYFNIETTYYQQVGTVKSYVKNIATFNSVSDSALVTNYPAASSTYSKSLSDADILAIVAGAIKTYWGNTPDPNGIYFVLTSSDVNEKSGFCSSYCAWHWSTIASGSAAIAGVDVKYGFVGNPARCPSACEAQTTSPNNDAAADSMADSIAHETEEFATDPDLNAWYDKQGNENADKCAWTFGTTSKASNGSKYNITFGGKNYLIQRNWVNANGGYCAMSY